MVPAAACDQIADWYEHEFLAGTTAPGTDPLGIDAALGSYLDGHWTKASWTTNGVRDKVGATHLPCPQKRVSSRPPARPRRGWRSGQRQPVDAPADRQGVPQAHGLGLAGGLPGREVALPQVQRPPVVGDLQRAADPAGGPE
jgi:hypothetical protein